MDRKFKGVVRKIVKGLKKCLKSICDSVCINKDEVYEVKFLMKVISVMEPKQQLIRKLNQFYLIVWSSYACSMILEFFEDAQATWYRLVDW